MRLELKEVGQDFVDGSGRRRVLNRISAVLTSGAMYAIVGPSGVGKTTLLSIMGHIRRPTRGSVHLELEDGASPDGRRTIASWIFQTTNLILHRSALDNVAIASMSAGNERCSALEAAAEALRVVGMKDLAASEASRMSGGERQRVAVARSLVADTPLLLADEPTAQLDEHNAKAVVAALRVARSDRRIVVVASHDSLVAQQADVVFRLAQGGLWAGD